MDPLTRRQQDILQYIADVQVARKVSPLLREIAEAFGISIGRVQKYVAALRKKGYLGVEAHARRGLRLTAPKKEWKVRAEMRGEFESRVGARLRSAADLDRVYEIVRGDLRAWLDVDAADLLVADPERRELHRSGFFGVPALPVPGGAREATEPALTLPGKDAGPETSTPQTSEPPQAADSLTAAAYRRRRAASGSAGDGSKGFAAERSERPWIRACAALPIPGRSGVAGILRLDAARDPAAMDETRLSRAALAAEALGPAIERALLNEDLRRRYRLQETLLGLCRSLNATSDLRRILREIYTLIHAMVDAPVFILGVKDDAGTWWLLLETDVVNGKPWISDDIRHARIGGNIALNAIHTLPYYILHRTPEEVARLEAAGNRPSRDGWLPIGSGRRSRSILYVPLKSGGEILGYLSAQTYRYNAYSPRMAEDLSLIGEYVGLALRSAWRREREKAGREAADGLLDRFDRLRKLTKDFTEVRAEDLPAKLKAIGREIDALRAAHAAGGGAGNSTQRRGDAKARDE